jgi:two-component system, sporulation sensor kinase A
LEINLKSEDIDFREIVENSPNSILIIEQSGRILYCNKAFLDLFKFRSSKDFLSKDVWFYLHPHFHQISKDRLKRVLENNEVLERIEVKVFRSDGELIDVEIVTVPYFLGNQKLAQVFMHDITRRKAAEKLLKNREKLSSVGQIAAGIAHEVKNPLTSVKGFLQLLNEHHPHPYINIIGDELTKALNTLQNLLQVSKPDLDDEPLMLIDLGKMLESQINLFQERLYKIEIEINITDSEKMIEGKRNLLQKALFNLIKNAIEAIEGVGKIRIEHFYQDGWIHIKISDTGVGIPAEKVKMLGTPFFSTKYDGTGLGLTQVYTTIHEHKGIISIKSEVGKGTSFHIQLPVKDHLGCG